MHVLQEINRFLAESGMPATKFGRLAVNDPRLVGDLRNGREPGRSVRIRVAGLIARERGQR